MIMPDIYVTVTFYSTKNNGRKAPTAPNFFGTIFVIGEAKHDCRLLLDQIGSIAPGDTKSRVPIKFLDSEFVIPKLKIGSKFFLWDMRNIAEGEIEAITKR